jgi:predicted nucleic acid-binding protein
MIVVADSSPLIVLANIGHVEILPRLFGEVIIPPQVESEVLAASHVDAASKLIASKPAWLSVQAPSANPTIPSLGAGETAAINLAEELRADLLLIDEVRGRNAAVTRKIRISGTIGVLELAASENLLDLKDAFERIKQTDFWISHQLLDDRLKLHQKRSS